MRRLAALAVAVAAAGCAPVGAVTPAPTSSADAPGYLRDADLARLAQAVPPAPVPGSPTDLTDKATSDRYRVLEGGDRWLLATAHAELRPTLALPHFDCALGTRLGAAETPKLTAIFQRILHDANAAAELAKARAFRPRPVGDDRARAACQRVTDANRASPSYPSGSASVGAAYGHAIAVLAPDRAEAARQIGHEIAVSRVVCAMHYPSDAAAGEALGGAVFAEIAATPAFQADVAAARGEIAAARASGLTNPGCAAERAALAAPLP